jgi:hypothetical protein
MIRELEPFKLRTLNIKQALMILIHQNIITYFEYPDKKMDRTFTYYRLNFDAVLLLLRQPSILQLAKEKLCDNELELSVFNEILQEGRVDKSGLLGSLSGHGITSAALCGILKNFESKRIIMRAGDHFGKSVEDYVIYTEEEKKLNNPPEVKTVSRKRKAYGEEQETTKARLLNDKQLMLVVNDKKVPDDKTVYAINYDAINVLLRNQTVVDYCKSLCGDFAAEVIGKIMEQASNSTKACQLFKHSDSVSLGQIQRIISSSTKVAIDGYDRVGLSASDRGNMVKDFIDRIIYSPGKFLSRGVSSDAITTSVVVDYDSCIQVLRMAIIESLIKESCGNASMRLFRCLQKTKILDDKALSSRCLVPLKETRERLTELLKHGWLELQEVPRGADRAPSRTSFFYRISNSLLATATQFAIKAVVNLYEVMDMENKKNEALLTKLQRTDVQADPTLLTEEERRQQSDYKRRNGRIKAYIVKMDEVIRILRDF